MPWFIGVVGRGCHQVVSRELAVLGYAAFYPRLKRWISHARTKVAAERPLLGPYLFTEIADRGFGRVAEVGGLQGFLVDAGGAPAAVPDEMVWDLRMRQLLGEFDVTRRDIPIGALVRIVEGEFAEALAIVTGVRRGKITIRPYRSTASITTRSSNVSVDL